MFQYSASHPARLRDVGGPWPATAIRIETWVGVGSGGGGDGVLMEGLPDPRVQGDVVYVVYVVQSQFGVPVLRGHQAVIED